MKIFLTEKQTDTLDSKRMTAITSCDEVYISWKEYDGMRKNFHKNSAVNNYDSAIDSMPHLRDIMCNELNVEKFKKIQSFPLSPSNALIIRGLPFDHDLPETPYEQDPDVETLPILTSSILGVFSILGIHPLAYEGENDDGFVRHVVPKFNARNTVSSYGSEMHLGMHMDNPHLPLQTEPVLNLSACPEYLSLMGVRCEPNVPTRIVDIRRVINELPQFVREQLMQPLYVIKRPESFSNQSLSITAPLLFLDEMGGYICRYNKANVRATTQASEFALNMLEYIAHLPENQIEITLNCGDLLIFKNQKTLHARDAFIARFDGVDRWLIRVFGLSNMTRTIPSKLDKSYIVKA